MYVLEGSVELEAELAITRLLGVEGAEVRLPDEERNILLLLGVEGGCLLAGLTFLREFGFPEEGVWDTGEMLGAVLSSSSSCLI